MERATRRHSILCSSVRLGLAALVAGCLACDRGERATPVSGPPTILLVSIDTLRADRVGCYGRRGAGTPALDALAAEGVRFETAQTTAPLTLPAHASLLAGRTLPAHGVYDNGTFALPEAIPTVAESFEKAGWATGAFVSSPVLARRYGLARGFAQYDDEIAKPSAQSGIVMYYDERPGTETVARALAWLERQAEKPALLWVHLWEPHAPYAPPPAQAARFPDDPYQGEVAAADDALAQLLDGIGRLGRRSRLLAVVTSDHGEGLGEHGEPTHGVFLYRSTMAVPLVISGPAWGIRQGAEIGAPVSLADVSPSLLELAGLPPLPGADGYSLAPALTGKGALPSRPGVMAESHLPQLEFGWSGLRAVVRGDLKLIEAPRPELFDLARDPREAEDLSGARPAEVGLLREAGTDLLRRARAGAPEGGSARSATSEELAQLQALGYAGSGRRTAGGGLIDPTAADPKDRARFLELHDRAAELARTGRHADALAIFAELERVEPRNPSLLFQHGQALIVAGRYDEAIAVFSRAVTVDPQFGMAWYRLGQLLDQRRDVAGAETAYRRAIEADPIALDPRKALAGLYASGGRFAEAADLLAEVLELDPGNDALRQQVERLRDRAKGAAPPR
ncbi:MAG: sulfatase-like hydrolase/transferase [Acidobacteria bacterium]|nr:sulfatase-like hydrolase/transferase [Acidobacteriota bacterium]MCU0254578.1 sulfatase-like hydrolase/transferase [Acidobacteriota bacterium]